MGRLIPGGHEILVMLGVYDKAISSFAFAVTSPWVEQLLMASIVGLSNAIVELLYVLGEATVHSPSHMLVYVISTAVL